MELSPELIGGLVTGIIGLITGLAGLMSKRSRELRDELEELRKERTVLRDQLVLTDRWLFTMKRSLAQNGFDVPEAPQGLQTLEKKRDD